MSFVLNVVVKPTLVLMCAAAASVLLRRSSAAVRHAMWLAAMATALLLPIAAVVVPQIEWSAVPEASTSVRFLPLEKIKGD